MTTKNSLAIDMSVDVQIPSTALPDKREECIQRVFTIWSTVDAACSSRAWYIGYVLDTLLERKETGVFEELMRMTSLQKRTLQLYRQIYKTVPDSSSIMALVNNGVKYADMKQLVTISDTDIRSQLIQSYVCIAIGEGKAKVDSFREALEQAVADDRQKRDNDKRLSTTINVSSTAPVTPATPPEDTAPEQPTDPKQEPITEQTTPSVDTVKHASMSSLLKENASVPTVLEALHESVSSAIRATDIYCNNLEILIEKASDTTKTNDVEYQQGWRKATVLLNDLDELASGVEKMKQLLIDGIPDPGTIKAAEG